MIKASQTEEQLTIRQDPHPVRLLISAPFFIAGGYFVYHLLSALFDYISNASAGEWLAALPGMLFMLILGLFLSLPGLFLASRDTVTVSRRDGAIVKGRQVLALRTRKPAIKLADVEKVVTRQTTKKHIDRKVGSTSGRSTSVTSYLIELELKNGDQAELINYTEKPEVKKAAKSLAEFAALSLNDRL